jgi:hypothetical protein
LGATVTITGTGLCQVTASQAGDANYNPAADVVQNTTIAKAPQTITFGPLANRSFGDPPFTVSATASSSLTVSFTGAGTCTVAGNVVTLTAPGSCTITASQPGDLNYLPATSVSQGFTVASGIVLSSLTLSPASCIGGCGNAIGKVTLSAVADVSKVISLTNTNPAATMPSSVTVPAGAKAATFTIVASVVTSTKSGTVSATLDGTTLSKTVTVKPVTVKSLSLSPGTVIAGSGSVATVTLTCKAPVDMTVTVTSSNVARATVASATLIIPAGSLTGTVGVSTTAGSLTSVTIKAKVNGASKSAVLSITP